MRRDVQAALFWILFLESGVHEMSLQKDKDQIGAALGRIPSGCAILTVEHQGQSTGLLVSWYQQVSFEPPTITVACKQGRPAQSLIDSAGKFVINVIGEDPSKMFKHFGKGFSLKEDAFAGLECKQSEYGPVLKDCIAHLGCIIKQKVSAGDHELYVAQVHAASADADAEIKPYVHLRKSGFSY